MSFLDRVNVGTAKLHGLQQDLQLTGDKFNIASLIFFVSYGEYLRLNPGRRSGHVMVVALCHNIA